MLTPYYSFLLRIWQAGTDEHPAWRASLEDPHTRQLTGFDNLEALLAHLRALEQNKGRPEDSSSQAHPPILIDPKEKTQ